MKNSDSESALLLDNVEAVLFDLDGTLLDTAPDLVNALFKLCDEEGQPPPTFDFAANHVSTGAMGLVRLAFPDRDDDVREILRQRLVDTYADNLYEHTQLYPGMAEVLEQLEDQNILWGVVTNKLLGLTEPLLELMYLRARMATVVGGDSTDNRKPHPEPILLALEEMGVAAEKTIYVGDAPTDIESGKAADTITVAVTWGYIIPGNNPRDWQADYTIDHPDEFTGLPALR
jgi:phosphoglycolate phosphatase